MIYHPTTTGSHDSAPTSEDMVAGVPMEYRQLADSIEQQIAAVSTVKRAGKVLEVIGTLVKVAGLNVTLGEMCELRSPEGVLLQHAEVIGFTRDVALLSPFSHLGDISRSTRVIGSGHPLTVRLDDSLLGRVIDSLGRPMDGKGPIAVDEERPIFAAPPDPLSRQIIESPLVTGVRVVDSMTTLGEGQRMGVFAPAGVGKSTLLGMFARGVECDVTVIALIGERGREVREFIELILGVEGMARTVVVCATADRSAIERTKAAYVATTISEYFRDRGCRVLLMMDSLTRFARAHREVCIASGELPARRGFPPSTFAELPRLLERTGMGSVGSITALYTVLTEDDTGSDPIAEEVRGVLDGHLVLSRQVAARNQYPAIDVLASLSRVMPLVIPSEHLKAAARIRELLAQYREVEMLLQIGEYRAGGNPVADESIEKYDAIRHFFSQQTDGIAPWDATMKQLFTLASA